MKTFVRTIAWLLVVGILSQGTGSAFASSSKSLDKSTAVAGASAMLRDFYESNEDAEERLIDVLEYFDVLTRLESISADDETEKETDPETETEAETGTEEPEKIPDDSIPVMRYGLPKEGLVSASDHVNIREQPSTDSTVMGTFIRGASIIAIGEVQFSATNRWYIVDVNGVDGYVFSELVAFGTEADMIREELSQVGTSSGVMPTTFEVLDSITSLPKEKQTLLNKYAKEIRYSLKYDYAKYKDTDKYSTTYAIVLYLLELYQSAADIAKEYGLIRTYTEANNGIVALEYTRAYLSNLTGQSKEELFQAIAISQNAAAKAAQEEAERKERERQQAEEAARAAAEAAAAAAAAAAADAANAEAAAAAAAAAEAARLAEEERQRAEAAAAAAAAAAAQAANEAENAIITQARQEGVGTVGRQIANYAATFIDILPYVWGGASLKSGADCSGFVGQILAHFGLLNQQKANVHGYCSGDFRTLGREVSLDEIQPGDVVCYNGHVALYFGNGICVHEPSPGKKCSYGSVNMLPILTIRRFVN